MGEALVGKALLTGRTGLQTKLSELECSDFSKSVLPALVFRPGFTTLHCAFSPVQDVRIVERSYLVSFWIRKFGFHHLLIPSSRIFFRSVLSSNHFSLHLSRMASSVPASRLYSACYDADSIIELAATSLSVWHDSYSARSRRSSSRASCGFNVTS
jgi:hypothetical protein